MSFSSNLHRNMNITINLQRTQILSTQAGIVIIIIIIITTTTLHFVAASDPVLAYRVLEFQSRTGIGPDTLIRIYSAFKHVS